MSIDQEIEQYIKEEQYSKRNIIKFIQEKKTQFDNKKIALISKINDYLHDSYWSSKEDYITAISMIDEISVEDIADHILIMSMKYQTTTTIQNVSNDLGNLYSKYIDDVFIRVQIGSDLLYICKGITYNLNKTGKGILFNTLLPTSSATKLLLAQYMYQPPMVCKPLKINNNYQSGYLTWNDSVILGDKFKKHNKLVRLDVINILNGIGFVLDPEVMKEKHHSKNTLEGQDLINWEQYIKEQELLEQEYKGKVFYFNHKLDSRQRIYSQGYHLNYQGDEYNKALISLAKKEIVPLG